MKPEISVIIPLYNKSRYIRRAVDSVLKQRFDDFELIVVDDGSTDSSGGIVRSYIDKRVRLIRQENAGPGAARNTGIAHSRGRLLAFLDADDEWMPEFLWQSYQALSANPDCDATACSYMMGDQDMTAVLAKRALTTGGWQVEPTMTANELIAGFYLMRNIWAVVCKKDVVCKYHGFLEDGCNFGEETFLLVQIMFNHRVYRIMRPLVKYHIEASELGPGRAQVRPLEPMLINPQAIRTSCCEKNRPALERFLSQWAFITAQLCAEGRTGLPEHVDVLARNFKFSRRYPWQYLKLRCKVTFPQMVPLVRLLKSSVQGATRS